MLLLPWYETYSFLVSCFYFHILFIDYIIVINWLKFSPFLVFCLHYLVVLLPFVAYIIHICFSQKAAKRKKIHAFKSKMRMEAKEVTQNKRQNAWQQFQTTKGRAKKVCLPATLV